MKTNQFSFFYQGDPDLNNNNHNNNNNNNNNNHNSFILNGLNRFDKNNQVCINKLNYFIEKMFMRLKNKKFIYS
jgi:hypothetical protein